MSDFPPQFENRCDACRPLSHSAWRSSWRRVWQWLAFAFLVVLLAVGVSSAFAAVGDDGYAYDPGCGDQGDTCPYSAGYHLRLGSGDTWSYLGVFGPAGAVQCPFTRNPSDRCYYLIGTAPAGDAQGTAGGVDWSPSPFPPDPSASGTEALTDSDALNALTVGLLVLIGGVGFIGGRLR